MKIAFISTNDGVPWGGSEELWYQTAKLLRETGIEVGAAVAKWTPCPTHIQDLIDSGVLIHYKQQNKSPAKRSLPQRIFDKFNRTLGIKKGFPEKELGFLESFQPDLVVISQGNLPEGRNWKQLCLKHSIPYVSLVQLVGEFHWIKDEQADILSELYHQARCNFFVSQKNITLAEAQLGIRFSNTKIVRNPFKVPYDIDISYPSPQPDYKLACVASLTTIHKGQDILFEILRQEKWRSRPIQISLFGKGVNERVLKRLKELWQLDMVKFEGFTEDISAIWKEHHALLMASRMEGLPLAVVEAMLCKRVAIVPDVGGNSEIIEDNVNGFLAKSATVESLDEAMERAWNRRFEWQKMGELAYQEAQKTIPSNPAQTFAESILSLTQ